MKQIVNRCLPAAALLLSASLLVGQQPSSRLIDAATALKDLQTLSSDAMEGRRVGTPGGAKARAYIVERFQASGLAPVGESFLRPFTFVMRGGRGGPVETTGINVVGMIPGTRHPERFIVVSAHYDHLGIANGVIFNGADDNASGTAALFSIAKYFSTHRPASSLIFAAFDGEEAGLHGSRAFVAAPPVKKEAIELNVNLDMIGRDPQDKLFAVGTTQNPFLRPYVLAAAAKAPVKFLIGHDDPSQRGEENWTDDSDHASFQRGGIPALYVGVEDYAQHHAPTDDYETMTKGFFVGAIDTSIILLEIFDQNLDAVAAARRGGK